MNAVFRSLLACALFSSQAFAVHFDPLKIQSPPGEKQGAAMGQLEDVAVAGAAGGAVMVGSPKRRPMVVRPGNVQMLFRSERPGLSGNRTRQ